ncbi:MAG: TIGR00341 family protein, partial [Bacteroidetes bacterium]|nr:TIGR00341 family protein [Bacteroidota bacterium]
MALRLVDIYLPTAHDELPPFEDDHPVLDRQTLMLAEERKLERVLLNVEDTEAFMEWLHDALGPVEDYRIILTPVEATLPRPEPEEENEEEAEPASAEDEDQNETTSVARISREELYQDVTDSISVTSVHYMLVALSTIVAAGGMLRDSVAVVIGAMVIAPLIGPNIALALGTTLADRTLLRQAQG